MSGWADALASNTALMTDVQNYVEAGGIIEGGTSGGSANAQTITPSPVITAYTNLQRFGFIAGFTNTGSTTLNVNSLGAKTLKKSNGSTNLSGNEILAGQYYVVRYDGTNLILCESVTDVWTTWSPTLSATGSMTLSSIVTDRAQYIRRGAFCVLRLQANFTTGGTASNGIKFTLPVNSADDEYSAGGWVVDASKVAGYVTFNVSTTTAAMYKYDASNFALAAGKYINCTMIYRTA